LPEEEDGLELNTKEMKMFRKGRDSDHLMAVPFECDLCHFRNLKKKDPNLSDFQDIYLLTAIRRANLDACWARATKTVKDNLSRHVRDYNDAVTVFGFRGENFLPQMGWPVLEDRVGICTSPGDLASTIPPSSTQRLERLIHGTPMPTRPAGNTLRQRYLPEMKRGFT
jgi:hypothetical protein